MIRTIRKHHIVHIIETLLYHLSFFFSNFFIFFQHGTNNWGKQFTINGKIVENFVGGGQNGSIVIPFRYLHPTKILVQKILKQTSHPTEISPWFRREVG